MRVFWQQAWNSKTEKQIEEAHQVLGNKSIWLTSKEFQNLGFSDTQFEANIGQCSQGWTCFDFFEDDNLLHILSIASNKPLIHIFDVDQLGWGYELYQNGKVLDRFTTFPLYDYLNDQECVEHLTAYRGNVEVLADVFQISAEKIAPYLDRNIKNPRSKAFEEDEFPLSNYWVCTDFLKRLGTQWITHPSPGKILITYQPTETTPDEVMKWFISIHLNTDDIPY